MLRTRSWTVLQVIYGNARLTARSFASPSQVAMTQITPELPEGQKPAANTLWDTLKLCAFTLGTVEGSFWLAGQAKQHGWIKRFTGKSSPVQPDLSFLGAASSCCSCAFTQTKHVKLETHNYLILISSIKTNSAFTLVAPCHVAGHLVSIWG